MGAERVRQWLIFSRAHTGMLEAPIAALGAAAALGTLFTPEVALWAVFGLLYHYSGYSMNSYIDWKKGYDVDDEYKSHHPLNTGAIEPGQANFVTATLFCLTFLYAAFLSYQNILALMLVVLMVACGVAYNVFGKVTELKFIPISIAHSLLFVIPYVLYAGTFDVLVAIVFMALFVHHTFQIAVSGDVKDLKQDESSFIKTLGMDYYDGAIGDILTNTKTSASFSYGVAFTQIAIVSVGYVGLYYSNPTIEYTFGVATIALLGVFMLDRSIKTFGGGLYDRSKRVQYMSQRELFGYWFIYTLLIPVIGITAYIVALVLSISYLFMCSKFMWGTYVQPKV